MRFGIIPKEYRSNPRLRRLYGNVLAFGFGCGVALSLFILVDQVLYFRLMAREPARVDSLPTSVPDDDLGYRFLANSEDYFRSRVDGKVIYNVRCRTDEHGRRVTFDRGSGGAVRKFALFFGGSYTFGSGVEDVETLPSRFAMACPGYHVYNYGGIGYGTQQMLVQLQSPEIRTQVQEQRGIAVYVLYAQHVSRVVGAMRETTMWAHHFPYFDLDAEGPPRRRGNFDTDRPFLSRFYFLASRSGFVKFSKLTLPLAFDQDDFKLLTAMVAESKRIAMEEFELEGFYVLVYPVAERGQDLAQRTIPYLKAAGIDVLDYQRLYDVSLPEYQVDSDYDGHPSALAHATVAETLVNDIGCGNR